MLMLLAIPILIISFFSLYILSRHDFVLIRKNVSVNQVFDLSFLSIIVAFFIGRIFFIINDERRELFNPIAFFHVLRYPGVSVFGFFVGGAISIWFLFRKTKALHRVYDIFTISFFPLFLFHLSFRAYPVFSIFVSLFILIAGFLFWLFTIRSHQKYTFKDGTISYLVTLLISLDAFSYSFLTPRKIVIFNFSILQIVGITLLIFAAFMLWANQKRIFTKK